MSLSGTVSEINADFSRNHKSPHARCIKQFSIAAESRKTQ